MLILAGRNAGEQEQSKALRVVAGEAMLSRVVHAWQASGCMAGLTIVGLLPDELPAGLDWSHVTVLPDQGSLMGNGVAGLRQLPNLDDKAIMCSCDIPLLTGEAIVSFLAMAEALHADLVYPIVSQQVMERAFPGAGRSYRKLAEGRFCGGDMMLLRPASVLQATAFFERLSVRRKSGLQLAAAIGPLTLVRYLLGRLPLAAVEQRASRITGISCRALIVDLPELAMDVDKPHQLAVVEQALRHRHVAS